MNETKHTPGPWRDDAMSAETRDWKGRMPCRCTIDTHRNVIRGSEGPCGVHAAAPEMLEALREVVTAWSEWGADSPSAPVYDAIDKARAAIAKATGR